MDLMIQPAEISDLSDILALQKQAYRREAELYNGSLPAMYQSLEEIQAEFEQSIFLKVVRSEEIVGGIRFRIENDTAYMARLIVHPNSQGRGLGTILLRAAEQAANQRRSELFTGHKSMGNLRLYRREGYTEFRREEVNSDLTLVYFEKFFEPK